MRVLIMLGFSNPFPGAAWSRIGYFALAASKKGHLVEVLGSVIPSSFSRRGVSEYHGVRILNLIPSVHLNDPITFFFDSAMSFAISLIVLVCRRPDVAVISLPPGHAGLGVLVACRTLRIRYIVDYRDEWEAFSTFLSKGKIGRIFFAIVGILTVSLYAKGQLVAVTENLVESLNLRGLLNVRLIPNGVDLSAFRVWSRRENRQKAGFNDDDFVLAYNGTIEPYYRLQDIVHALRKIKNDVGIEIKFLVVGGGTGLRALLGTVAQLELIRNVTYVGVKETVKEVAQTLASADVGLIPFDDNPLWRNALPAKFYEYCASGIPILATIADDSLIATFLRNNAIGLISPPLNQNKLAENILWIYYNPAFRREAGVRARMLAEQRFDKSKITKEFLGLLETVYNRTPVQSKDND